MLTRSKRGALVYVNEEKSEKLDARAILAIVALIVGLLLLGLPGDPMHGASKYQPTECAGLIECFNNN